jgi:hypothetical protein
MGKIFIIATGVLMSVLLSPQGGAAADRMAARGDAAQEESKPAASGTGMAILVHDPRSSGTITVPVASADAADLPVAEVNSDRITVDDLRAAIAAIHEGQDKAAEGALQAPRINLPELLDRLINAQLIYQEAQNIGLDELPEVTSTIDVFRQVTLRGLMREAVWKDVTASDAELDNAYRETARQVRTSSVFFEKAQDAKKASRAIKSGKNFDDVVTQAVHAGTAKGTEMGTLMKARELDPAIRAAIAKMKIGAVSPVTKINLRGKPYYVLFRYEAEQFNDSPEVKEQARQAVLGAKKTQALAAFLADLNKKYATFHTPLVESLDYGPQGPGLEKLMDDQRIVVEIKGDKPVTVADLSAEMQDKFYHGMKNLKGDKMLKTRRDALEAVVQKRLLLREALNRGIDQTPLYKNMIKSYTRDMVFGVFVQKVLAPSVKVSDEDLRAYYRDHAKEYVSEPRVKARSLLFGRKEDAVAAIAKLKKGADFAWVKANAPGQAAGNKNEEPPFPDSAVTLSSLAGDVQRALEGAASDDARLYEGPTGLYYVLYVEEMVPPQQQPFEQVREAIRPNVFYAKLNQSVDEWTKKLRESADITVYLAGFEK